ncbi:MAG: CRISPR-associated protein Cas4 [Deltaproteobacteria bacterium]|nr:CRISPR-associated protein Cas4 [Deltaproteobacteria bacterium]
MFDEDDLLPLSGLQHVIYCERRFALVHVECLWAESNATVDGRHIHERAHEVSSESRGDVTIARGLWLRSLRLGLSGKADVVELHRIDDSSEGINLLGVSGRWSVFPVEYKRGVLRHEQAYAVQLCAQAMALEEMMGTVIPAGAVYYGKSHRREDVPFSDDLRASTEEAARRIHEIARSGSTPPPVPGPKCGPCSMKDLCLPDSTDRAGKASVFLVRALRDASKADP